MLLHKLFTAYGHQTGSVLSALGGLGLLALLAWLAQRPARPACRWIEWRIARVARRRGLAVILVGLLSLSIGLVVTAIWGAPVPRVHDEFSYLLASDTFAQGRLTNPTHPMWRHFETMHVLWRPTYMSKFQPAPGLMMALGQALFGAPGLGVILGTALACAAIAWALFGWLPPKWALVGGIVAAIHPQIVGWSHMYWGGSVGMLGGALVFGAIGRLLRNDHLARNSVILALGGAILATSRPYEAIIWGILSGVTLLAWIIRSDTQEIPRRLARLALPAIAVLVPVICFIGYYNWRITENPLQPPYLLHARQYMAVPLMFWQRLETPKTRDDYRHEQLADQHLVYEWHYFHGQRTLRGWAVGQGRKLLQFADQHLRRNPALLLGLLAAPFVIRGNRWMRLAGLCLLAFIVAYASIPWFEHHYVGVIMVLLFALAMQGLRGVRAWRPLRRARAGRAIVWLSILACAVVLAIERGVNRGNAWPERHAIERRLINTPGRHLVFVRYADDHDPGVEWVYNAADIDGAKVIWARQMSPAEDRELREYFHDRQVWLLHADERPARIEPVIPSRGIPLVPSFGAPLVPSPGTPGEG